MITGVGSTRTRCFFPIQQIQKHIQTKDIQGVYSTQSKMNFKQAIILFSAIVVILTAAAANAQVVELTSSNFDKTVLKSEGIWMVAFIAPWCGHCQKLHPEYEKAAQSLGGVVNMGRINCDEQKDLAMRYGIQGYPTIKIFNVGEASKKNPENYQGARSSPAIVNTLLAKFNALPDPVKKLDTPAKVTEFVEDTSNSRVILLSSKDTNPNLFKSIAIELKKNSGIRFAFIPYKSLESITEDFKEFSGLKPPTLLIYPKFATSPTTYDGKMKKDGMLRFINAYISDAEEPKEKRSSNEKNLPNEKKKGNLIQIEDIETTEKLKEYCEKMCAFAIVEKEEQKELFASLVREYGKHETIKYAFVHPKDVKSFGAAFGIDESSRSASEVSVPVVVLRTGKHKYAAKGDVTKSNGEWFFEQILYGLKFNSIEEIPSLEGTKTAGHDEL